MLEYFGKSSGAAESYTDDLRHLVLGPSLGSFIGFPVAASRTTIASIGQSSTAVTIISSPAGNSADSGLDRLSTMAKRPGADAMHRPDPTQVETTSTRQAVVLASDMTSHQATG